MSFLEINKTLPGPEIHSCSMDPSRGASSGRQSRIDRRQLWNRERLQLLRRAQDNAARQRQQAELRRLTDQLLGVLAHLEGPAPAPQHQAPPPHRQPAADVTSADAAPPPASRGSWISEQLDLLTDLQLIEH